MAISIVNRVRYVIQAIRGKISLQTLRVLPRVEGFSILVKLALIKLVLALAIKAMSSHSPYLQALSALNIAFVLMPGLFYLNQDPQLIE